jgi:hypothetical protein
MTDRESQQQIYDQRVTELLPYWEKSGLLVDLEDDAVGKMVVLLETTKRIVETPLTAPCYRSKIAHETLLPLVRFAFGEIVKNPKCRAMILPTVIHFDDPEYPDGIPVTAKTRKLKVAAPADPDKDALFGYYYGYIDYEAEITSQLGEDIIREFQEEWVEKGAEYLYLYEPLNVIGILPNPHMSPRTAYLSRYAWY